jgi:hypothetical protein
LKENTLINTKHGITVGIIGYEFKAWKCCLHYTHFVFAYFMPLTEKSTVTIELSPLIDHIVIVTDIAQFVSEAAVHTQLLANQQWL